MKTDEPSEPEIESEPYLWDRSAPEAEDVKALEALLAPLAHRSRAVPMLTDGPKRPITALARRPLRRAALGVGAALSLSLAQRVEAPPSGQKCFLHGVLGVSVGRACEHGGMNRLREANVEGRVGRTLVSPCSSNDVSQIIFDLVHRPRTTLAGWRTDHKLDRCGDADHTSAHSFAST